MKNETPAMTEKQIGSAMFDIAQTSMTMERLLMILLSDELEDDLDREALLNALVSLAKNVGCVSDSVSEQIGEPVVRGPRAWHLHCVPAGCSAPAAPSL